MCCVTTVERAHCASNNPTVEGKEGARCPSLALALSLSFLACGSHVASTLCASSVEIRFVGVRLLTSSPHLVREVAVKVIYIWPTSPTAKWSNAQSNCVAYTTTADNIFQ